MSHWSRRQESNLHLSLRRTLFYPLNYGEIAPPSREGAEYKFPQHLLGRDGRDQPEQEPQGRVGVRLAVVVDLLVAFACGPA